MKLITGYIQNLLLLDCAGRSKLESRNSPVGSCIRRLRRGSLCIPFPILTSPSQVSPSARSGRALGWLVEPENGKHRITLTAPWRMDERIRGFYMLTRRTMTGHSRHAMDIAVWRGVSGGSPAWSRSLVRVRGGVSAQREREKGRGLPWRPGWGVHAGEGSWPWGGGGSHDDNDNKYFNKGPWFLMTVACPKTAMVN